MFSTVAACHADLRARYLEPHRGYHGLSHPEAMLREFAAVRHLFRFPEAVELAIWYHDAVYDPARADNEERSARLMREHLDGLVAPRLLDWAEAMILATRQHRVPDGLDADLEHDLRLFLDLDLGVLAADPAVYDEAFEAGVAFEYLPLYGDAKYRAGRADVLDGFLARERLYFSEHFHARLEARARANLRRAIQALRAPPGAATGPAL